MINNQQTNHAMPQVKRFAVMGNPIAHSRSPEIHTVFAAQTGIALTYDKLLVGLDGFALAVADFFQQGGAGLNVTVPFKEEAFALCQHLSQRAQIAGAVNTLWMQDGVLHGDNTDGVGLVNALRGLGWQLSQARVLILGAGGAARGVIYPLLTDGMAQHITIANRTVTKAEQLVDDVQSFVPNGSLSVVALDALTGHFDLVINATSASLHADALVLPETLSLDYAYEMAYGKDSPFLVQAAARGATTADGLSMLWGQAAEAFLVWNGVLPRIEMSEVSTVPNIE